MGLGRQKLDRGISGYVRPLSGYRGSPLGLLAIVGVAVTLGGCGEGATDPPAAQVATVTRVSAPRVALADSEPIVTISGASRITKADLEHWVLVISGFEVLGSKINGKQVPKPPVPVPPNYTACIARLTPATPPAQRGALKSKCEDEYVKLESKALGFLITTDWIRGEAARLHLTVSRAEIKHRLDEIRGKYYPKPSQLKSLRSSTGETIADLLWRSEGELLQSRIAADATQGKTQRTEAHILLGDYQEAFQARWKSRTSCRLGYVIEDCMQFKTPPPIITQQQKEAHTYTEELQESKTIAEEEKTTEEKLAKHETVTTKKVNNTEQEDGTLEEYNLVAGMNLASPAFERNGQVPTAYTCDGAGISPPLKWARIPSQAKAMVLVVIDDNQSNTGSGSGVRWVVANIDPKSTGVAAGQVPEGGIVGADSQGHPGYGGICPEHGMTDPISFVLYLLKEKVDVKPGFTPQEAESQYGGGKLLLNEHAVDYAKYTRP